MARKREFVIKESFEELNAFKPLIDNYKKAQRLNALILLKENPKAALPSVADRANVHSRTLDGWIKIYKDQGIEKLLSTETRNKPSKIITPEIHAAIEEKLKDEEQPFSGYVEVQEWLKEQFEVDIEYQWLWKYLRTKFNTRLKVPRKVNIKKKEGAEATFFKTT